MGRKTAKGANTSSQKNNRQPKDSSNLQNKIENSSEISVVEPLLNAHISDGNNKTTHEENVESGLVVEASGSSSRPKRRSKPVLYCSPQSRRAKQTEKEKASTRKNRNNETNDGVMSRVSNIVLSLEDHNAKNCENIVGKSAAIALDKIKFDINIDPNVKDRYTDSGFTAEGSTPESPETRRQRIDIISRQCRLHPANKKYNQGPVENPPLIKPGKMVGYTPGGQRHEVDLNFGRPTLFNSEYARMQWDYATRVNVSRMFHDLETGMFLAEGLDPNIERRYFAEQEMATKQSTEHFQKIASRTDVDSTSSHLIGDLNEDMRLLEAEKELIELNRYAVVRLQDFAGEVDKKLRKALDLTLTPLMIKKNPVILDTIEKLATQCIHIEVVSAARALLAKIQGLFEVPENQNFRHFFDSEVEKLKEKTKDMSGFDIMMMTEELPDEPPNKPVEAASVTLPPVEAASVTLPPVEEASVTLPPVEAASVTLPPVEAASVILPPVEEANAILPPDEAASVILPPVESIMRDNATLTEPSAPEYWLEPVDGVGHGDRWDADNRSDYSDEVMEAEMGDMLGRLNEE